MFEENKKTVILSFSIETEKKINDLVSSLKEQNIKVNFGKIIDNCITKLNEDNYLKDFETIKNYLKEEKIEIMSSKKIGIRLSISNLEKIDNLVNEAKQLNIKFNRTKLIIAIVNTLKDNKVFNSTNSLKEFIEVKKFF